MLVVKLYAFSFLAHSAYWILFHVDTLYPWMAGYYLPECLVQGLRFDSRCVFCFFETAGYLPSLSLPSKSQGQPKKVTKTVLKTSLQARVHVNCLCFNLVCTMQDPRVCIPKAPQPEPSVEFEDVPVEEVPLWCGHACAMFLPCASPCQDQASQMLFDITRGMSANPRTVS